MSLTLRKTEKGICITVKAVPNASREEISGTHGEALKIRTPQPPERGRANSAIAKFLAKTLGIGMSQIELIQGESNRLKVFCVSGLSIEAITDKFTPYLPYEVILIQEQ